MVDTTSVDMLALVMRDTKLKKAASTKGGEWKGSCPFCGGDDRLCVWPNLPDGGRFWCRQCQRNGDAIAYVMAHEKTFQEACEQLRVSLDSQSQRATPKIKRHQATPILSPTQNVPSVPDADWQRAARVFCEHREDILWSKNGQFGREYLAGRGLRNEAVIEAADLGYNPVEYQGRWGGQSVRFPPGITIPWIVRGEYWGVNVRNLTKKGPKYMRAAGSVNSIYRIQYVRLGCIVVMVETEFDALVIRQELFDLNLPVVPVATGSISWGRPLNWLAQMAIAGQVLVAFDLESDVQKIQAVENAAAWWLNALGDKAKRLLPTRHDVTDMLLAEDDITAWVIKASGAQPISVAGPKSSDDMKAAGWVERPIRSKANGN